MNFTDGIPFSNKASSTHKINETSTLNPSAKMFLPCASVVQSLSAQPLPRVNTALCMPGQMDTSLNLYSSKNSLQAGFVLKRDQQDAFSEHVDGDVTLLRRMGRAGNGRHFTDAVRQTSVDGLDALEQTINRRFLLVIIKRMLEGCGVEVEGLYLTGSSVNRVYACEAPQSDLDFVVKLKQDDKSRALLKGQNRTLKNKLVESLSNFKMPDAGNCFGVRPYTSENTGYDSFLFQFGEHDTDVVITAADADYALVDRAWRIDVTDYVNRGKTDKLTLIYLHDPKNVHKAVKENLIDPGAAKVSWDKMPIICKRLAAGATFSQRDLSKMYFKEAINVLEACSEEGGVYLMNQKMSGLSSSQIVHGIFEFARQLPSMQGSSVTELAPRFYEQVLLSVLKGALYKEGKEGKEGVGAFESDSPKRALCEILLGIDYKDLEHSTEALTRFFALDALMTQTGRFTRLDAVDQPDQIRLEYPWGDSKLHLTFSHTHTASQGSELTKEQLVNNSTLASRDDLYGYAQRLNKPKVAAYIEQVQSEENKKISLSLNMPLNDTLNDTMATLSLSEVKQEAAGAKEEGVAVEVCEHVFERWEKGASSLRKYMTDATGTINPCRSIAFTSLDTSIEDASSVLINYMGNPLQLNAENIVEAHSDESLSGGATLFIESRSLGRPAIIKGDFTLNKSEGLQLNSDQALFESGGAQYEGPVKFIKNSQGKIVDVVPEGRGTLWPNKQGYPELFLKGQWSASGTLNISDIEGVDIGEANLTAQWFDVLTTLNTMPMYGEKVLDGDRGVIYAGDFELTMVDRLSLIPSKGTLFQKGSSDNVMSLELMSGELYLKRECVNGNWVAVLPEVSRQDGVRTVETSLAEPRKEGGTASTDHSGQLNKKNVKKNVKKNGKKSGKKSGKKNGKKSGKRTKSGQTNQHVSHDTLSKKAYYLTVNYICSNDKILSFRAESEYRAPAVNECSTLEGRLAYHLLEHEMTGVLSMSASNAERNAATLLTSEYGRARVIEDRLVVDQFFMSRSSDHIEAPDGYEVVTPILYKVLENGVMDVSYALVNKKVRQPLRQEGNSYEGESLMVQYHGCFDDIDNFQDGIQHVSVRALNRVYVDTSKYFLAMTHSDYNSYFNSDDQRLMLTRIHKGEDSGSVHMEYLTPNGVLNACWSEPFYLLAHNAPVKDPSNKFVMSWKCYAERDIEQSDLELKNHQDLLPFTPLKRTLEKYFQIFSYSTGLVAHVSIKDHSNSGQYLLISSVSSKEQQDGIDLHLEFELGDEKGARFLVSKLEDGEMVVLQEWEEGSGDLRKLQRQLPDSDFYRTHAPKLAEIATVVSRYYLVSQSRLLEGADAVMALDPQPLHLGFGFSR